MLPPGLRLQVITSHDKLPALPHEQAYYALVNIEPAPDLKLVRMPLNLGVVLDRSATMQGARLQQVKEATRQIITRVQDEDALTVVIFNQEAEVLLSKSGDLDRSAARASVNAIKATGRSEPMPALALALDHVEQQRQDHTVNHVILLTTGQATLDADACRQRAEWAGSQQISLTTIGLGTDWDEDLLDQMATISGGQSVYVETPDALKSVFHQTVRMLESVLARNLRLSMELTETVSLHRVYQVVPYIRRLHPGPEGLRLGPLSTRRGLSLMYEFRVSTPSPGLMPGISFAVDGHMPLQENYRSGSTVTIKAEVVEAGLTKPAIPAPLAATLGKLTVFKMQEKVMDDLAENQIGPATRRLELIATRLLNMGEAELAQAALIEAGRLARTGQLSPAGRKKIHYGTRALTGPLPRENESPDSSGLRL